MNAVYSNICVFLVAAFAASLHSEVVMHQAVSHRTLRLKSIALEQLASALAKVDQCQSRLLPAVLLLMNMEVSTDGQRKAQPLMTNHSSSPMSLKRTRRIALACSS